MHILPSLYTGGAEKFCIDICNELSKNPENEVYLCSLEKLNDRQRIMYDKIDEKVNFLSMNKVGKHPTLMFDIYKMLKQIKPDITHTHLRAQVYAAFGIITNKIPNIHTVHSLAYKETTAGKRKLYALLYRYFNFTPVSISKEVLKSVQEEYGPQYDIQIDNGVQKLEKTSRFTETKREIDALKKDENTKIFVNIGRVYPVKNQKLLIEAFDKLLDEGANAHLLIIGSRKIVPEYAKACETMTRHPENIHFLDEKSNVSDYLLNADAFCLSSSHEGMPMTILEAMSIGLPTIATPVGGIPDIIEEGENGFLSKDLTAESYLKALKQFLSSETLHKKSIIDRFEQHYSIEITAKRYYELYKQKLQTQ
jgi:glycosyltransferase involved in cell wall biosynthesis